MKRARMLALLAIDDDTPPHIAAALTQAGLDEPPPTGPTLDRQSNWKKISSSSNGARRAENRQPKTPALGARGNGACYRRPDPIGQARDEHQISSLVPTPVKRAAYQAIPQPVHARPDPGVYPRLGTM